MINPEKLMKMAMKWQREAVARRRISLPKISVRVDASTSSVANKGHFVVYTADQKCFMIPYVYLNNNILREFGLPKDGPIRLPCDAVLMMDIVNIIQQGLTKETEKALLISIATSRC